MEAILSKTATGSLEEFAKFSETLGGVEHISSLLECASNCPSVRSSSGVLEHLAKVLASLTYANAEKMSTLMAHFTPSPLDFDKFDSEHTPDDEHKVCTCLYLITLSLTLYCTHFYIRQGTSLTFNLLPFHFGVSNIVFDNKILYIFLR